MPFLHKHRAILVCLFLVVATAAVYYPVHSYDFVNLDDGQYVYENRNVKDGLTLSSVSWALTSTHAFNWHPITWLSHILDSQLYGMDSGKHHLTNLILHIANALLLYFILTEITGAFWPSAFVAGLFALHPVHIESVAWISERKDVLSAFFWMLTTWSYVRWVERPKVGRYLLVLFLFGLGIMAKPMVVTLPFVLVLMDYWPLNRMQHTYRGGAGLRDWQVVFKLMWGKAPLFVLDIRSPNPNLSDHALLLYSYHASSENSYDLMVPSSGVLRWLRERGRCCSCR